MVCTTVTDTKQVATSTSPTAIPTVAPVPRWGASGLDDDGLDEVGWGVDGGEVGDGMTGREVVGSDEVPVSARPGGMPGIWGRVV